MAARGSGIHANRRAAAELSKKDRQIRQPMNLVDTPAQAEKERYQDPILPRDTSRRNTAGLAHSTYLVGKDNLEMIGYHKNLVIMESFYKVEKI